MMWTSFQIAQVGWFTYGMLMDNASNIKETAS